MFRVIKNSEDIFGMSSKQSKVASGLDDQTLPITTHLAKIYLFPTAESVNHWKSEVYGFLHNVPKLKSTKKLPTPEFIIDNTINMSKDLIPYWYEDVYTDYIKNNECRDDADFHDFESKAYEYFEWLADTLSTRGHVSATAVYEVIDSIFVQN